MVACIGINPSTAKPNELDNTLQSVRRIAAFNGFDGWVMYNVYPQRATNPNDLDASLNVENQQNNTAVVAQSVQHLGIRTIWVAYGDLIESREYLPYCLLDLYKALNKRTTRWVSIEKPTRLGHPRHPLYKKSESALVAFDMNAYIRRAIMPKVDGAVR